MQNGIFSNFLSKRHYAVVSVRNSTMKTDVSSIIEILLDRDFLIIDYRGDARVALQRDVISVTKQIVYFFRN